MAGEWCDGIKNKNIGFISEMLEEGVPHTR